MCVGGIYAALLVTNQNQNPVVEWSRACPTNLRFLQTASFLGAVFWEDSALGMALCLPVRFDTYFTSLVHILRHRSYMFGGQSTTGVQIDLGSSS